MRENIKFEEHHGFPWKQVIGFVLSIILTVAALWVVFSLSLTAKATIIVILALASAQLLVQLIMFMHLSEHEKAFQISALVYGVQSH
ncbi:cytochrome o ubiquinol oxidase subunit IV [Halobacillus amylolyticus]|uniref:Cytochrome C oxidase subunit IV family protein n=1 Tax=Halobacillus amylolyticus TaxID=2932259 RepID=A0ABY4HKT7_9BACI|nr:cytochrome C oxidase subunit IV family protein [Halobacillus amylolyticus]UOR14135.1 cytochrome C oxidase subunit IV family protein [Halobacillus amylolyticus]